MQAGGREGKSRWKEAEGGGGRRNGEVRKEGREWLRKT